MSLDDLNPWRCNGTCGGTPDDPCGHAYHQPYAFDAHDDNEDRLLIHTVIMRLVNEYGNAKPDSPYGEWHLCRPPTVYRNTNIKRLAQYMMDRELTIGRSYSVSVPYGMKVTTDLNRNFISQIEFTVHYRDSSADSDFIHYFAYAGKNWGLHGNFMERLDQ